jgi:hypothetical protein
VQLEALCPEQNERHHDDEHERDEERSKAEVDQQLSDKLTARLPAPTTTAHRAAGYFRCAVIQTQPRSPYRPSRSSPSASALPSHELTSATALSRSSPSPTKRSITAARRAWWRRSGVDRRDMATSIREGSRAGTGDRFQGDENTNAMSAGCD